MNRPSHALPFAVALALLLSTGGTGCKSVLEGMSKPSASLRNVRLADLNLESVTLLFDVDVKNPYDFDLPLVGADYTLTSGAAQLLKGAADAQGSVPAQGSRTLTLPANLKFADVLSALQGVKPGAVVPYHATVNFRAHAPAIGPVNLPVSKKGELPVPAAPKVELTAMQVKDLSLANVAAVLNLRVTNPNSFPFDLHELGYNLSLGGASVAGGKVASGVKFARNGTGDLTVPVSFSPMSLGVAVFNMLKGSSTDYDISGALNLSTPFGPINMPYQRKGQTTIRHQQ